MASPKWSDLGNVWNTLRELDVSAVRDEAERALLIACVGHPAACDAVAELLNRGSHRYGPEGGDPLALIPFASVAQHGNDINRAHLLLLAVDAEQPLTEADVAALSELEAAAPPFLLVIINGETPTGAALPRYILSHSIGFVQPAAVDAPDRLADALLERLPGELHLAAARRLPGLRNQIARDLINTSSFTNATYALASGLPEQVPILSVPFAAADIFVLTKNQALLVYRLALAYGAAPDFQARIRELAPVIGAGFMWRQAARTLIGLIPVWGLVPKIAIAYAGTYTTGVAAWRWFGHGELIDTNQIKRLSQEAFAQGRQRAKELVDRNRDQDDVTPDETEPKRGVFARLRDALPFGRKDDSA